MTTIIYDHKRHQIACDGRITVGGHIGTDDAEKYATTNKGMLFFAGTVADFSELCMIVNNYEHNETIGGDNDVDAEGLLVSDAGVYEVAVHDGQLCLTPITFNASLGSGGLYAIVALDFGKTAKKAVEYAATKDCYTGGVIRVYDIKKGGFV